MPFPTLADRGCPGTPHAANGGEASAPRSPTGNEDAEVPHSGIFQIALQCYKEANALLRHQSADIADDEGIVRSPPVHRGKRRAVHAASHQKGRIAGAAVQQFYQFGAGRERCRSAPVNAEYLAEYELLNAAAQPRPGHGKPPCGIFMDLRVPRDHQGDLQFPGRDRPQNAQLAGADQMNDVRRELPQSFLQAVAETVEQQIETKVRVDPNRDRRSLPFQNPERILRRERLAAGKSHA